MEKSIELEEFGGEKCQVSEWVGWCLGIEVGARGRMRKRATFVRCSNIARSFLSSNCCARRRKAACRAD